jgi:hypothetical protein
MFLEIDKCRLVVNCIEDVAAIEGALIVDRLHVVGHNPISYTVAELDSYSKELLHC